MFLGAPIFPVDLSFSGGHSGGFCSGFLVSCAVTSQSFFSPRPGVSLFSLRPGQFDGVWEGWGLDVLKECGCEAEKVIFRKIQSIFGKIRKSNFGKIQKM